MAIQRLVLASASPYRRDLLTRSGVPIEAIAAKGDEKSVKHPDPGILAGNRACFKALDVLRTLDPATHPLVIGADQVVNCGRVTYDKAADEAQAREHLTALAGRTHGLFSAVALAQYDQKGKAYIAESFMVQVPMTMRSLSKTAINQYLALGEWQGSVGGYKIEGVGAQLFEAPLGDYFSIIGMPLTELFAALRRSGVDLLENPRGPWSLS